MNANGIHAKFPSDASLWASGRNLSVYEIPNIFHLYVKQGTPFAALDENWLLENIRVKTSKNITGNTTKKTSRSRSFLLISHERLRILNRPEMLLKSNEKPTLSTKKFENRSTGALVILESP